MRMNPIISLWLQQCGCSRRLTELGKESDCRYNVATSGADRLLATRGAPGKRGRKSKQVPPSNPQHPNEGGSSPERTRPEPADNEPMPKPPSFADIPSEDWIDLDGVPSDPFATPLPGSRLCLACGALLQPRAEFCPICGWFVPEEDHILNVPAPSPPALFLGQNKLRNYRLLALVGESSGVQSFHVVAEQEAKRVPAILRARLRDQGSRPAAQIPASLRAEPGSSGSKHRSHGSTADTVRLGTADKTNNVLNLEFDLLMESPSPRLPQLLDYFVEGDYEVLVETLPIGQPLMRAWRAPHVQDADRFHWLEQLWEALTTLHHHDVVFPLLQPSRLVVTPQGLSLRDLTGITQLPAQHAETSWFTYYAAPELLYQPNQADIRCDAYSFGAVIYALYLGRELNSEDFEYRGCPRPFASINPDAPPPLVRLLGKTFVHNVRQRFPTVARRFDDPGGFEEILSVLKECRGVAHGVRYDIAGWSTTGVVRDNNEDCFAAANYSVGAADARRDLGWLCVADGMGGLSSGEVASSMAVSCVTDFMRGRGVFAVTPEQFQEAITDELHDLGQLLREAMQEANRRVWEVAEADAKRAQMGCTLEAVLLIGRQAVIGHVGDSRVYHLTAGCVHQITKDQTLVGRMVEMGQLSVEEAAVHPYRSAIFQAIGTQPDLEPLLYFLDLADNDWLVVCSDGLTAHVNDDEIQQTLLGADSAESAARRLVNLANTQGGSDNCTVVVARIR